MLQKASSFVYILKNSEVNIIHIYRLTIQDNWEHFNNGNVASVAPHIEIVTKPDIKSAEEVIAFSDKLRIIIRYTKISDCRLIKKA